MSLTLPLMLGLLLPLGVAPADTKADTPKTRTFEFTYAAKVTGLTPGQTARIWVPVPPTNDDQSVQIVGRSTPASGQVAREPKFGNVVLYVEGRAGADGTIPLSMTYQVRRHEVKGDFQAHVQDEGNLERYLKADAKVPVGGKSLDLVKDKQLPPDQMEAARALYDVVNGHMRYSKQGTGWGRGDSDWACQAGFGNCTDFHSVFMSLARAYKIPCKFEIGFPLPAKHGAGDIPGYHCWAKFHPEGHGWIPVDISEANKDPKKRDYYFGNLTEDRVAFSTGRDLELVPRQAGAPLNFFVYPYVEVDGKPYDKVERHFSYRDESEGR